MTRIVISNCYCWGLSPEHKHPSSFCHSRNLTASQDAAHTLKQSEALFQLNNPETLGILKLKTLGISMLLSTTVNKSCASPLSPWQGSFYQEPNTSSFVLLPLAAVRCGVPSLWWEMQGDARYLCKLQRAGSGVIRPLLPPFQPEKQVMVFSTTRRANFSAKWSVNSCVR